MEELQLQKSWDSTSHLIGRLSWKRQAGTGAGKDVETLDPPPTPLGGL